MDIYRLSTWLLILILICQSYIVIEVKSQPKGSCSLLDIDIQRCLFEVQNSESFDSCCEVLHQALEAGHHCLCLLLSSSGLPLIRTPLLLLLSSCVITVPSLTCQDPIATPHVPDISGPPVLESPPAGTALPVIKQPPVNPEQPVLIPPPQSSASDSSFLPLVPTSNHEKEPLLNGGNLPAFRIPERVSSSNNGVEVRFWSLPSLMLVVVCFSLIH